MTLIKVNTRGAENIGGGRRNLLINGGMMIAQRGTGATTVVSGSIQVIDKGYTSASHDGAVTKEQSTDVPVGEGFQNSVKHVVTTADTSIGASQYHDLFHYRFEGNELTQLNYGTSGAKKSSLSFFVKSSVAGVYCGTITIHNNSCKLPFKFTIASANTWERIKIENIPAITTGGDDGTAWITSGINLGAMLRIYGALGSNWSSSSTPDKVWNTATNNQAFGSATMVNWLATVNNTFYLTGVQWEVNEICTDFEHRSFEEELHSCKRYYQKSFNYATAPVNSGSATSYNSSGALLGYSGTNNSGALTDNWLFSPEMRTTPTVVRYGNSSGHWGRMSMPNSAVTYDNGAGYISNTQATGLNFGQNVAGNTHICGFGHATADADLL